MAKNQTYLNATEVTLAVASGVKSGDPVEVSALTGVAVTDRDADGNATVSFGGAYDLSVKGVDGAGNSAVAVGDRLYYTNGDTPKLNKKTTGKPFGWALAAVTSGATATIAVKLDAN